MNNVNEELFHRIFFEFFDRWQVEDQSRPFDLLTIKERTVVVLHYLVSEVFNGGFEQWITNPTGEHTGETIAALRRIRADNIRRMVEEVLSYLPGGTPATDQDDRFAQMETLSEEASARIYELDGEFDQEAPELYRLIRVYWESAPDEKQSE